jgi:hypothetical protein
MPKREVTTKFYCFNQNNSGGSFKGSQYVIVEALNSDDANRRAEDFGIYFGGRGDCRCCGSRWSTVGEYNGADFPHIYEEPLEEHSCKYVFTKEAATVHYMDGTKKEYEYVKSGKKYILKEVTNEKDST